MSIQTVLRYISLVNSTFSVDKFSTEKANLKHQIPKKHEQLCETV